MASTRSLAERISSARKRQKIKQEALAGLMGCTRSYISKLESGRVIPSKTFAEKLESALSLRLDALASIVRVIRRNEAELKRQAVEHARGIHADGNGNGRGNSNGNGCIHCESHQLKLDGRKK